MFAPEPLSILQIQQALATREGDFALSADSLIEPELVTRICCGFISLGSHDGLLRAFHYTAQDYLESNLDRLPPKSPLTITQTCLDYLINTSDIGSADERTWRHRVAIWPLAKVALIILNDYVIDQRHQGLFHSMLTGRTFVACQIAFDGLVWNRLADPRLRDFPEK